MASYTLNGREVRTDKGKLVATLNEDGVPVMAPGMAGPHSRAVRAFLAEQTAPAPQPAPPPTTEADSRPESPQQAEAEQEKTVFVGEVSLNRAAPSAPPPAPPETPAERIIADIPADLLPPFSPKLGVNTPGFAEFVAEHHLTQKQVCALIDRITRTRR